MSVESGRDNETGKSDTVANLLDDLASGSKSGRSDVGTAVVVDNNADNDVDDGDDSLAEDKSLLVVLGLTHLSGDGEEDGSSAVGEDECRDSRHGLGEGGSVEKLVVGNPDTILRSEVRAVLDTDSNGNDEDGDDQSNETDPSKPRNTVQSSDGSSEESNDHGNSDEDSSASSMLRQRVQGDGKTEHSRTGDTDGEKHVRDTVKLPSEASKDKTSGVVDTVDFRVALLELANDIVGPGCDDGDGEHADDTGDETEGVEGGGNG